METGTGGDGKSAVGKREVGAKETHCNREAEKANAGAQREGNQGTKAKKECCILNKIFSLVKKVPE